MNNRINPVPFGFLFHFRNKGKGGESEIKKIVKSDIDLISI